MAEASGSANRPEPLLLDVLAETDLSSFEERICYDMQLTRLDHFDHVKDSELQSQGLSLPAVRRLRQAIDKRKKKRKGFFTGSMIRKGEKDPRGSILGNRKSSVPNNNNDLNLQSNNNIEDSSDTHSNSITCLITKDQIKLMEKIGEGSFAEVRRALWTQSIGPKKDVAVKLLRDRELSEEVREEIDHMHHLKHMHLMRLYGIVFARPIMLVVELCEGGSLLDRLTTQAKPTLLATQLAAFATHVAKGMAYLEEKRFIHRDLACRNVLLTKDEKRAKIGDFGLMRALPDKDEHYIMSVQKKVPFAWCPPESLRRRQFSHASDVWSYGVTLWEMFSYGEEPWVGYRGPEILQRITDGERLPRPNYCPATLYNIMMKCWDLEPSNRPKFVILRDVLLKQFQFSIAECKQIVEDEKMMKAQPGHRIIVIEEGVDKYYWFGQNAHTGEYGSIPAKSLQFMTNSGRGNISAPLCGSFMHTGHGDAKGGASWGQPHKIDDIYLKNPMPLIDLNEEPSSSIGLGAEVVETINDAKRRSQPVPLRPPPINVARNRHTLSGTNASIHTNDHITNEEVDPFAPFETYSMLYGIAPGGSSLYYSPVPQTYDVTGPSVPTTLGSTGSKSSVPEDPHDGDDVYGAVRQLDHVSRVPTPPAPTHIPIVSQSPPIQTHKPPARGIAQRTTSVSKEATVVALYSPVNHRTTLDVSNQPDPFEVSNEVKLLVNKPRYSDYYQQGQSSSISPSLPSPPVFSPPLPNPTYNHPSTATYSPTVTYDPPSTAMLTYNRPPTSMYNSPSTSTPPPTSNYSTSSISTYNHPTTSTYNPVPPSAYNTMPHLTHQMQRARISVNNNVKAMVSPISHTHIGSVSASARTSSVADVCVPTPNRAILDLFDPLTSKPNADLVRQVKTSVPFASDERCAIVLHRCAQSVQMAVQELKIEKLVDTGIATTYESARVALSKSQWDVNNAAAFLLG